MSIAAERAGSGELVLSQSSLTRLREALSAREEKGGPDAALQEEGAPVAAPEAGMEAGAEAGYFVLRGLRPRPPSYRPPQALSTVSSIATIANRAAETLSSGLSGPWSGYLSQPRLSVHHPPRDGKSSSSSSSTDTRRPAEHAGYEANAGDTVQLRRFSSTTTSLSPERYRRSSKVSPADGDSDQDKEGDEDDKDNGDAVSPLRARRACSRLPATSGSAAPTAGFSPASARLDGGKSPLAKRSAAGSSSSRLSAVLLSMRSRASSSNVSSEGSEGFRSPAGARLANSSSNGTGDGRRPVLLTHGSNITGSRRSQMQLSDTSSRLSERRSRLSSSVHDQSYSRSSSRKLLSVGHNSTTRLSIGHNSTSRRCSSIRNSNVGSDSTDPSSFLPVAEVVNLLSELELRLSATLMPVLRCFVPTMVERKAEDGQHDLWVSEHRKLVTIFLKVLRLGPTPCEVAELGTVHRAVRAVQESVIKHGGTVTRLICDDKGARFLIAFGLPGQSSEDDERRAVLCSLACAAALREIDGCLPAHLAAAPSAARSLSHVAWSKIAATTLTPAASCRSGSGASSVSLSESHESASSFASPLPSQRGTSMLSGQGFKRLARRKQHQSQWLKGSRGIKAILTQGHAPEHAISCKLDCATGIT